MDGYVRHKQTQSRQTHPPHTYKHLQTSLLLLLHILLLHLPLHLIPPSRPPLHRVADATDGEAKPAVITNMTQATGEEKKKKWRSWR